MSTGDAVSPSAPAGGRLLFWALSALWIVSGGLVAAVTGPLDLEHGSWAAAYQVLVGGVVQAGLGAAQHELAPKRPSAATLAAELLAWNLGSVAVIAGTVATMPLIVDVGGLLLIVALVLLSRAVRGRGAGPAWAVWTCRALLVITLISIPIGLVLAHMRAL